MGYSVARPVLFLFKFTLQRIIILSVFSTVISQGILNLSLFLNHASRNLKDVLESRRLSTGKVPIVHKCVEAVLSSVSMCFDTIAAILRSLLSTATFLRI